MSKDDIYTLLQIVEKEDIIQALCHWFSVAELNEFVEHLRREGLIENNYY